MKIILDVTKEKSMIRVSALIASALLLVFVSFGTAIPEAYAATSTSIQENPCAPPQEVSNSIEETAWAIWIAATCPVNDNQYPYVVWENWIEQTQLYPADPSKGLNVPNAGGAKSGRNLHHSPLTLAINPSLATTVPGLLGAPDITCNKAATPPANQPNLIICEEVRENGATEDYIAGTFLWNRFGQQQAALNRDNIQFPAASVEIKADWIQLSSIGLDCANLPLGFTDTIHVEFINGHCFGLAGMHVISKLIDKWIWATFEPQNLITNPARCQVLGCTDAFGSRPVTTHGEFTQLSPTLERMMDAANLAPVWKNYRLDGVQTDYLAPKLLGNSIIEGENAGVPLTQSSCISCHAASAVKNDGTDGITLLNSNPVGLPEPLPSTAWIRRDFVWSLSEACPGSPFPKCVP
jgi:hypothetical protein